MKRTLLINNVIDENLLLNPFKGKIKVSLPDVDVSGYNLVLVYDVPVALPFWFKLLNAHGFSFRYHIVVYFDSSVSRNNLIVSHVGVLYAFKNKTSINKVRIPHSYCEFCGKTLKDWGGKKHLMHPDGALISDVWKHLDLKLQDIVSKDVPKSLKDNLLKVFGEFDEVLGKKEIVVPPEEFTLSCSERVGEIARKKSIVKRLINGDAVEILKTFEDNTVDMVFIDPPYNLNKNYDSYKDERDDYVSWSLNWLNECFRVLKPYGSLFLLNIPKWIYEILPHLLENYYLQRWIVWDNQAEPKGKLIPAHYPLIWLSKTREVKTYPLGEEQDDLRFCLRASCRKKREKLGVKDKIPVRDVRWDIHRVKHSRKRFEHPTQLPAKLLSFLIRLTTCEGDVVLDPMMGVGTTPVVAKELNRSYVGIDISETYTRIAEERIKKAVSPEDLRPNVEFKRNGIIKKKVQLEVGELSLQIGRIPTVDEFCNRYGYRKEDVLELFSSWSKATKYAKLLLEKRQRAGKCVSEILRSS